MGASGENPHGEVVDATRQNRQESIQTTRTPECKRPHQRRKAVTQEKKEKPEKIKCAPHNFIVTGWVIKGGHQNATLMRCTQCLMPANLEELESKEWKESQGM